MVDLFQSITVTKYKYGKPGNLSYPGKVIELSASIVKVEAYFNQDDLPVHGVVFRRGDRFLETYFSSHWYNILEVHDRDSEQIKCWYCNISKPAVFGKKSVWFVDLALDMVVYPDKHKLVVDEDEFEALKLPQTIAIPALAALHAIKSMEFN
jgi:uncharacterized protein